MTVNYDSDNFVGSRFFLPTSPRPLSAEVPDAVANDYKEAYLIRDLSPKASATLARRALQGMIRDFWKVSAPTLHAELKAIEAHCDPDLYAAMMQVKSVGNIGAHPEKDISIIVDIYPGEAEQLLELLHHLDQEWYVARRIKRERLAKLKALGEKKEDARTPAKAPGDQ